MMNGFRRLSLAALAALIAVGPSGLAAAARFCRPKCCPRPVCCTPAVCDPVGCDPVVICDEGLAASWSSDSVEVSPPAFAAPIETHSAAPLAIEAPVEGARPLAYEAPALTPPVETETIPPPVIATPESRDSSLQPVPQETPYNEAPAALAPAPAETFTVDPATQPPTQPSTEPAAEPASDPVADLFGSPPPRETPYNETPATEQPAVAEPAAPTFVAPTTPSEMTPPPTVTPAPAETAPPVEAPATAPLETVPPAAAPAEDPSSTPDADDLFDLGATLRTLDEKGGWASDAMRTWTDATGQFDCAARLVEATGDAVLLVRADGREVSVPYQSLSSGDLEFVHRQIIARRAQFAAEGQALVASPQR